MTAPWRWERMSQRGEIRARVVWSAGDGAPWSLQVVRDDGGWSAQVFRGAALLCGELGCAGSAAARAWCEAVVRGYELAEEQRRTG